MPERCIDANIAVKWFIKGEAFRHKALKLLRESEAAGIMLIAPPLFEMETDSIIQTRVVHGLTTPAVADKTLVLLDYAALAELRGCEFWTADKVFYDAVKAVLSFVKYLPDYP